MWQTVTVASPPGPFWSSSNAIGLPTICDRPRTTAWAPRVSTPAWSSNSRMPSGVHGTNRGVPCRQQAEVDRVEAVDVLQRRDPFDDRPLVDVPRQGHLDEDAVHRRVGVEPVDRRQRARPGSTDAGSRRTVPFIPAAVLAFCLLPT